MVHTYQHADKVGHHKAHKPYGPRDGYADSGQQRCNNENHPFRPLHVDAKMKSLFLAKEETQCRLDYALSPSDESR